MMRKLAALGAALTFVAAGGCSKKPEEQKGQAQPAAAGVKIGFINSITGPEAPIGENLTNGVTLAVEDLQKKGIDPKVIRQDDTGKPAVAVSAMEQLATGDQVSVVVGPYTSSSVNAVAPLANQAQVPQVVPAAAKEDITRQGFEYVFRVNAPASRYAQALLDAALSFGQPKSIAFIYESTDFGTSVSEAGRKYAEAKGLKVVGNESYQKGSTDYRSTLNKLKGEKPDLVFMVSYVADAIILMRQAKEVGLAPQAYLGGGAGFDTAQFESEKDISTNVFSVTQWTPEGFPGAAEFAERYKARFGKKPTYHAACAYAAMMIAGEVAQASGGDRAKIKQALDSGGWQTLLGPVKFQDLDGFTNQNQLTMPVTQYQDGKSVVVFPAEIAKAKAVYPFPGWK